MANYVVDLTPALKNMATEGSMDSSLNSSGNSIQRTFHGLMVVNGTNRKMVGKLADGGTFDDTVGTTANIPNVTSV
jgi:hypothetical protein